MNAIQRAVRNLRRSGVPGKTIIRFQREGDLFPLYGLFYYVMVRTDYTYGEKKESVFLCLQPGAWLDGVLLLSPEKLLQLEVIRQEDFFNSLPEEISLLARVFGAQSEPEELGRLIKTANQAFAAS